MEEFLEESLEELKKWLTPKFLDFLAPRWGLGLKKIMEDMIEWLPSIEGEDIIDLFKSMSVYMKREKDIDLLTLEVANKQKEDLIIFLKRRLADSKKKLNNER